MIYGTPVLIILIITIMIAVCFIAIQEKLDWLIAIV